MGGLQGALDPVKLGDIFFWDNYSSWTDSQKIRASPRKKKKTQKTKMFRKLELRELKVLRSEEEL